MVTLTKRLLKTRCFWYANLTAMLKIAQSMCTMSFFQSCNQNTPILWGCMNALLEPFPLWVLLTGRIWFGFGFVSTKINIVDDGMRGYLEVSVPWVIALWCLAHCLQLSMKNALKDTTLFSVIDEILLQGYCLYEKSTKKCHRVRRLLPHWGCI